MMFRLAKKKKYGETAERGERGREKERKGSWVEMPLGNTVQSNSVCGAGEKEKAKKSSVSHTNA